MYGSPCGSLLSKLAPTASPRSCQPKSAVGTAQATSSTSRWLNTRRSSRLPDLGSKEVSMRRRLLDLLESQRLQPRTGGADQADALRAERGDAEVRHRLHRRHRLEAQAAVAAQRDAARLVDEHDRAAGQRGPRGGAGRADAGDGLPPPAFVVAAEQPAAHAVGQQRAGVGGDEA